MYEHRRLRASFRVRLAILPNGKVRVTTPIFFPEYKLRQFFETNTDWILEKVKENQERSAKSIFPVQPNDFLVNKSRALRLVREKISKFNAVYGFKYNKVSIKNVSTRWGSCSKSGNLNFNYKMIYLPEEMADYIVVHELCHLQEMNHGKNFWRLVAITLPDWKKIRSKLKNIF